MVQQRKKTKTQSECNNSDLPIKLQQMQDKFSKEIQNEETKLINEANNIIKKESHNLFEVIVEDLPKEFLEMKYKDYLEQKDSKPSTIVQQNDTMMIVEDIRNKVIKGNATPETVFKYQELKRIFK